MAAQAAPLAGHHPGRRRPAAAHCAVQLQALGLHREDWCSAGRHPSRIQGKGVSSCNIAICGKENCSGPKAPCKHVPVHAWNSQL